VTLNFNATVRGACAAEALAAPNNPTSAIVRRAAAHHTGAAWSDDPPRRLYLQGLRKGFNRM
jgi:hypothetical protein